MEQSIQVKKIWQQDERTLGVQWSDDEKSLFDVVMLRKKCPCAFCVDEWSNEPILKAEDVSDDVRPVSIDSVGRYAMSIKFSDGHATGIYTFKYLRSL